MFTQRDPSGRPILPDPRRVPDRLACGGRPGFTGPFEIITAIPHGRVSPGITKRRVVRQSERRFGGPRPSADARLRTVRSAPWSGSLPFQGFRTIRPRSEPGFLRFRQSTSGWELPGPPGSAQKVSSPTSAMVHAAASGPSAAAAFRLSSRPAGGGTMGISRNRSRARPARGWARRPGPGDRRNAGRCPTVGSPGRRPGY